MDWKGELIFIVAIGAMLYQGHGYEAAFFWLLRCLFNKVDRLLKFQIKLNEKLHPEAMKAIREEVKGLLNGQD